MLGHSFDRRFHRWRLARDRDLWRQAQGLTLHVKVLASQRILRELSADVKVSAGGTEEGPSLGHERLLAVQIDGQRVPPFGYEGAADEVRCERDCWVEAVTALGNDYVWAGKVPFHAKSVGVECALGDVIDVWEETLPFDGEGDGADACGRDLDGEVGSSLLEVLYAVCGHAPTRVLDVHVRGQVRAWDSSRPCERRLGLLELGGRNYGVGWVCDDGFRVQVVLREPLAFVASPQEVLVFLLVPRVERD